MDTFVPAAGLTPEAAVALMAEQLDLVAQATKDDSSAAEQPKVEPTLKAVATAAGERLPSAGVDAVTLDGFFSLLASGLGGDDAADDEVVKCLCTALTAKDSVPTHEAARLAAGALNTVYALAPARQRPALFAALHDLLAEQKEQELLAQLGGQLQARAEADGWTAEAAADARKRVRATLEAAGRPQLAATFVTAVLAAGGGDAADARLAVSSALGAPTVLSFDELAAMPAVAALGADGASADDKAAHALLKVASSGVYKDFAGNAAHAGALKALGVDEEAFANKLRVLTLASLANAAPATAADEAAVAVVAFADIADALDVPAENVESWCIDGVGAGAWQVKIDTDAKVARVSSFVRRAFAAADWKRTAADLAAWGAHLDTVIDSLSNPENRAPEAFYRALKTQ